MHIYPNTRSITPAVARYGLHWYPESAVEHKATPPPTHTHAHSQTRTHTRTTYNPGSITPDVARYGLHWYPETVAEHSSREAAYTGRHLLGGAPGVSFGAGGHPAVQVLHMPSVLQ